MRTGHCSLLHSVLLIAILVGLNYASLLDSIKNTCTSVFRYLRYPEILSEERNIQHRHGESTPGPTITDEQGGAFHGY